MDRVLKAARASGSLNLSNRSLRLVLDTRISVYGLEVPDDVYKSLDAVGDDEKWWEAVELQKLILAHNDIESLKEDLKNLPLLVVLNVSHNKLTSLPAAIGELHMLKSLDVSFNSIEKIPEEIGSAASLVNMPESIGRLSRLVRLDLHQNRISSIPSSIKGCSSLLEFYIGSNALSLLPAEIGSLTQLGTFDLHSNQLKEYPVAACSLHLSVLDLSNNSLSGLPAEIGLMTTLRKLILTGNPMRTLRSSLVHGPTPALLKYLRSRLPKDEESEASTAVKEDVVTRAARLSIGSKDWELSHQIWKSSDVTKVDLSGNSIEELPSELRSCVSLENCRQSLYSILVKSDVLLLQCYSSSAFELQALILSKNKIKEWPAEVLASLPRLLCLKLDGNPLRKIPSDGFRAASKLQILDLSGTSGSLPENPAFLSLPAAGALPEVQNLKSETHYIQGGFETGLGLNQRMQISSFPLDIMTLQQLRILDFSQNSLQSIPESIKDLTSLTELNLSDNNISSLPPNLGLLEPHLKV
ncbi:Plant intracellular Ras-group-related LRR protein 6 [Sesamum angolense]|uniref:Plant intracellular Ras-group-related LRR protein 6 n=1 Tax=Sesamum angolense TaxID=2727404 RepID=A0AAE1W5A6_9LAMI|nr:Plant intracellular Ras-group-related LRR protein 6 [Sesamum angolense]